MMGLRMPMAPCTWAAQPLRATLGASGHALNKILKDIINKFKAVPALPVLSLAAFTCSKRQGIKPSAPARGSRPT